MLLILVLAGVFSTRDFCTAQSNQSQDLKSGQEKKMLKPPETRVENVVEVIHGQKVEDPYRWLENGESEEAHGWVNEQNAYSRSILNQIPGRKQIGNRLEELLSIGYITAPQVRKGRYFYEKREGKQNQPVLYVREGLEGEEQVLLDPNSLSKEGLVVLDWWHPSDDGKLLAYGLSQEGTEQSTLYVMDVEIGENLSDQIPRTRACGLAWKKDESGFYYTRYPKAEEVPKGEENYHRHVFYHALGTEPDEDREIFGKGRDMEDWTEVDLSPDNRFLLVTASQGWSKSEMYFRDLQNSDKFVPIVEGIDAIFIGEIVDEHLYLYTNYKAPKYRVLRVDLKKPSMENWQELIPEDESILQAIQVIGSKIVAQYMQNASSRLKIFSLTGEYLKEIELPALGSVYGLNGEWDGSEALFGYQSFFIPPTIYYYDLETDKLSLHDRVKADIDSSLYQVRQIWYRSKDGTKISMFLVHKKGLKLDGNNPTLLTGYGGFNASKTPLFYRNRFLWLESGGVYAVPNLRGGGEYGEEWHKAGMLENKQNVFDDFISAAEWLISNDYTAPSKLVIYGGSNGGLLVGAALTQRPDLFKVVVCGNPLLDMLRYQNFLIARLWIPEYGTAEDPEQFKYLYQYSPYHRVQHKISYPATLFLTAESDTRVDPMHALKMTARLQAETSSDNPILLRFETKAGHGAGTPLSKVIEEYTDIWSFIYWQLGMEY
ncbi:MAG: S9 family peptidase [candidate division Zixibacteria bacterium]|nr:S9 family peptidase [candidate division Zixibacteria bacterium]